MADELEIPPIAEEDRNSVEILRVWAAQQQQHVSLRWDLWDDPAIWGVVLADLAGHVANAFERQRGKNREETLSQIQEFFNKELNHPTDEPRGRVQNKRKQHRSQRQ